MLTPAPQSPDNRGNHWLQAKTQQILAESTVALATPRCESDPSCYWGTDLETNTTLYLRLAGDPELKALRFGRTMIMGCGSGRYAIQERATMFIRRTLTKMGILAA
jgi:hypothetical protein